MLDVRFVTRWFHHNIYIYVYMHHAFIYFYAVFGRLLVATSPLLDLYGQVSAHFQVADRGTLAK
jgi:hypothetical protein